MRLAAGLLACRNKPVGQVDIGFFQLRIVTSIHPGKMNHGIDILHKVRERAWIQIGGPINSSRSRFSPAVQISVQVPAEQPIYSRDSYLHASLALTGKFGREFWQR